VSRLVGTRDEDGNFVEFPYDSRAVKNGDFYPVSGVEVSKDAATVNIRFSQRAELVNRASGEVISEVAGIPLDNLRTFRQYTLVACGDLNVNSLTVKISKVSAFNRLATLGAVSGPFDPTTEYTIDLTRFPLVAFGKQASIDRNAVEDLFRLKAVASFLAAATKGTSSDYTDAQVEALKAVGLTPALNFSFPTTVPYTDRAQALADGIIDEVPEYKVTVGTLDITGDGKLLSANKFLDRFYAGLTEMTVPSLIGNTTPITRKVLGARVKVTAVDNLMAGVFDVLLGLTPGTVPGLSTEALNTIQTRTFDAAILAEAKREVEDAIETLREQLRDVVFYIGATGQVPTFAGGSTTLDAETFATTYPNTSLSKDEKEGTFIVLPNGVLITVYETTRTVGLRKTA
jgi:hypothetical protein